MIIRSLTVSDRSVGNRILQDVFIGEGYVDPKFADKLTLEVNEDSGTWIGSFSDTGQLVGLVLLTAFGADSARVAQPNGAEIRLLAVSADHRRSGVAFGLVKKAERMAVENGHVLLSLSTQEPMGAAQALYRRLGYRECPDRSYESMGIRFLVYEIALSVP